MERIFPNHFLKMVLLVSIWVNVSEVFRYFLVVMPELRKQLAVIPNVAPMDWWVFSIWGLWDTILTAAMVFITWLCYLNFGKNYKTLWVAGITCWVMFFLLFWIGLVNMNLAQPKILFITLPLCLLETTVTAWIILNLIEKYHA